MSRFKFFQVKKIGTFAPPKGSKKPQAKSAELASTKEVDSTEPALAAGVEGLQVSETA